MTEYERPAFKKKWWQKVETFLEENPQLGFDPEDMKYFIKYCVKKEISRVENDRATIEDLLKQMEEKT